MANPAPGFAKHPEHTIALEPSTMVIVQHGEVPVAESREAVLLSEDNYPLRAYLPAADITATLVRTDRSTHCPFKGDATYFDVIAGEDTIEGGAWCYEAPFDEMAAIAGLVAFDDRFALTIAY